MYFIRQTTYSVGKFGHIGTQLVRSGVTAIEIRPAVIRVDVSVTRFLEAFVNNGVGGFHDLGLVDVAAICVPGIPSHRRNAADATFEGMREGDGGKNGEEEICG